MVLCSVVVVVVVVVIVVVVSVGSLFDRVRNPLRLPRRTTSERPKVVQTCSVFNILTWKCASRQRRALFRHRNF